MLHRARICPSKHSPLASRVSRILGLGLSIVVAASLLTAVSTAAVSESANAAASSDAFDAGEIISDSVMYDFGTMSAAKIQRFLDSKVSKCDGDSPAKCLKDYRVSTKTIKAIEGRCDHDIKAKSKQTAAQIIYTVARACEVNPQVLLVTLQKEQGLVTRTSVSSAIYRKAMGYGCPDTAACDSKFYGFFNQVYWAARAYNSYVNFPENFAYRIGKESIRYSPRDNCGTKSVTIVNGATAALYNYTPYTPNKASLAHPYKTGDKCSSYGNRNFWLYFNDWFGSSVSGTFLIKTPAGKTYLMVNGERWEIPKDSPELFSAVKPFGSTGKVSTVYANSLARAGTLSHVVKSSEIVNGANKVYLLDRGKKLLFDNCAQVQDFGFSCGNVPTIPLSQLNLVPSNGRVSEYVKTTSGLSFYLGGDSKREVLDQTSLGREIGTPLPAAMTVDERALADIAWGSPIIRDGVVIRASNGSGNKYYTDASGIYRIPAKLDAQTKIAKWLSGTTGELETKSMNRLPGVKALPTFFRDAETGAAYLIGTSGKVRLAQPEQWRSSMSTLASSVVTAINSSGSTYQAPRFIRKVSNSQLYFVVDGERRPVASSADRKKIAKTWGVSTTTYTIPDATAETIPSGGAAIPAGVVVKRSGSGSKWLIDGAGKRVAITAAQQKEIFGTNTVRTISSATLSEYTLTAGGARLGIQCGTSASYISDGGILRRITGADLAEYGSAFDGPDYDVTTCGAMKKSGYLGTLIAVGSKRYAVEDGTKRLLTNAQYTAALKEPGAKAAVSVSTYFAGLLKTQN